MQPTDRPKFFGNERIDEITADIVHAEITAVLDPEDYISVNVQYRERFYKDIIFQLTKKFARGKQAIIKQKHNYTENDYEYEVYWPWIERFKRWCQKYLHATAPWFTPKPITYRTKVITNNYYDQEVWHVVPDGAGIPLIGMSGMTLRLCTPIGWLDPDMERASQEKEYLDSIYTLAREVKYLRRMLSYYEGNYQGEPGDGGFSEVDQFRHTEGDLTL